MLMKRLPLIGVLAGALFLLPGCFVTTGGTPVPVPAPAPGPLTDVGKFVEYVQNKSAEVCRFVPSRGTILNLIKFYSPDAAGVIQMIRELCDVVSKKSGNYVLHGVPINGHYSSRPPTRKRR